MEISAEPTSGYVFKEWSDGSTDAQRTVEMTEDVTLVAKFEKLKTYYLQVSVTPSEAGNILIDGRYNSGISKTEGESVLLSPVASECLVLK